MGIKPPPPELTLTTAERDALPNVPAYFPLKI